MIKVYFKPGCNDCVEAKSYLDAKGIEHEDINLADKENREARAYYRSLGIKTLPVIEDDKGNWILPEWDKDTLDVLLEIQ